MSSTSVDLPEPETPVTTVSSPSGKVTSMSLSCCARAPRTVTFAPLGGRREPGTAISRAAADVESGHRCGIARDLFGRADGDDLPAMHARRRADVDDVVGGANRLFVVFDDEHGVAEVAQRAERFEQRLIVARMQTDGWLVQNVEHAAQLRADLRGETDALAFAAGERR